MRLPSSEASRGANGCVTSSTPDGSWNSSLIMDGLREKQRCGVKRAGLTLRAAEQVLARRSDRDALPAVRALPDVRVVVLRCRAVVVERSAGRLGRGLYSAALLDVLRGPRVRRRRIVVRVWIAGVWIAVIRPGVVGPAAAVPVAREAEPDADAPAAVMMVPVVPAPPAAPAPGIRRRGRQDTGEPHYRQHYGSSGPRERCFPHEATVRLNGPGRKVLEQRAEVRSAYLDGFIA